MKLVLSLLFVFLYTESIFANTNTCATTFSGRLSTIKDLRIVKTVQDYFRDSKEIREALQTSGLKPEEIEGLRILDAVGEVKEGPSYQNFMAYIRNVFGAKFTTSLINSRQIENITSTDVEQITRQLGGELADITLAMSKLNVEHSDPQSIRTWMQNLTKVTTPGGLIVIEVSKRGGETQVSSRVFESILSELQVEGLIEAYTRSHTNKGRSFTKTLTDKEIDEKENNNYLVFFGLSGVEIAASVLLINLTNTEQISHGPAVWLTGALLYSLIPATLIAYINSIFTTFHKQTEVTGTDKTPPSIVYRVINGSS